MTKWAIVSVKNYSGGLQWCRDNLSHNDWVVNDNNGVLEFRFRDEAIAVEFALRW